jgi:hypothetical protein
VSDKNDPSETTTSGSTLRPPFARSYPEDPRLAELLAAFERGNYGAVRDGCESLASTTRDPRVKAAAIDLRQRVNPDIVSAALLVVGLGLALFIGGHFLFSAREHRDAPAPPITDSARP